MQDKKFSMKMITLILSLIILSNISCNPRKIDETPQFPLDQALKDYYFKQLEEGSLEQKFYNAIKKMHTDGLFQKGTESIDVVDTGFLTQAEVNEHSSSSMRLVYAMGAARDAFVLDYPEVFYVNFEKLSVRLLNKKKKWSECSLLSSRNRKSCRLFR